VVEAHQQRAEHRSSCPRHLLCEILAQQHSAQEEFVMASAHPLTDHDEIKRWAEARRAKPACVKGTGGKNDPGMIRLDFPGFSGSESLQHISWDEWFKAFDENDLALLVQDETAEGARSNFNKLVSRETVHAK
jgi:hypothetical protein